MRRCPAATRPANRRLNIDRGELMTNRYISLSPSAPHNLFDPQHEASDRICKHIPEFPLKSDLVCSDERPSSNHVIALLGGRGTGKTTALLHTRRQLLEICRTEDKRWLIADLFMPDVLHSRDAIGPAVVQLLQAALFDRAEKHRSPYAQRLPDPIERLVTEFLEIQSDLAWFLNSAVPDEVLIRDSVSARQFAQKTFDYHKRALTLPVRFMTVLEAFLEVLEIERLILLIDDADISIDLVEPIIDFIRYFLATPYVITVIAADYETLRRRLFNNRIGKLDTLDKLPGGSGISLFGGSSEDFKVREVEAERDYVDAYLLKILPPATRIQLQTIDHSKLLSHRVMIDADRREETTENLLSKIGFHSLLEERRVSMAELVRCYPGVLESNLRAFINQFNVIYEIADAMIRKDRAFFGLAGEPVIIAVEPGLLQMKGHIDDIDEAALLRVLRVFLSSTVHANWREVWSYFKIIDVMQEPRLARLIDTAVSRIDVVGTAVDTLILRISGKKGENTLSLKEEVEVFHLLIDLALHFGVSFGSIMRFIGISPSVAYPYFSITNTMHSFLEAEGERVTVNFATVPASREKRIPWLLTFEWNSDAIQPVYLGNAREMARYFTFVAQQKSLERKIGDNNKFKEQLAEENISDYDHLALECRQMYGILYSAMNICVDHMTAAYTLLFHGGEIGRVPAELQFVTNLQLDWGIVSELRGWSFLRRIFQDTLQSDNKDWDRLILLLMQAAQLPYEIMVACFSASSEEAKAQNEVKNFCQQTLDRLEQLNCVRSGTFVDNDTFRTLFAGHADFPHLAKSFRLWPEVDFGIRGKRLLRFLTWLIENPRTLAPGENCHNGPPSAWKEWVERMEAEHRISNNVKPVEKGG